MNPEQGPGTIDMSALERALDPNWTPDMSAFEADLAGDMQHTVVEIGATAIGTHPELGSPFEPGAIIDGPLTEAEVEMLAAQLAEEDVEVSPTDMALMPGIEHMLSNASIAQENEIEHVAFHESVLQAAAAFMLQMETNNILHLIAAEDEDDEDEPDRRPRSRRLALAA